MALYVFSAADFKPSSSASVQTVIGGEAIAVGDAVYRDATLDKWFKCDADSATPASGGSTAPNAGIEGLCASACAGNGCRMSVVTGDTLLATGASSGEPLAEGQVLVLSGTAGKLQPAPADAGDKLLIVGGAMTATSIKLGFLAAGTAP
jgi:hypothetical protein